MVLRDNQPTSIPPSFVSKPTPPPDHHPPSPLPLLLSLPAMADLENQHTGRAPAPSYATPLNDQQPSYRESSDKNHPHAHTTATAESGSDLSQRNSREKDSQLAQAALAHEVAEDEHEVSTSFEIFQRGDWRAPREGITRDPVSLGGPAWRQVYRPRLESRIDG